MKTAAWHLPVDLLQRLAAFAVGRGETQVQVVVRALERELADPAPVRPARDEAVVAAGSLSGPQRELLVRAAAGAVLGRADTSRALQDRGLVESLPGQSQVVATEFGRAVAQRLAGRVLDVD